jgi:soluble lytic murein transglycosylase-like protein
LSKFDLSGRARRRKTRLALAAWAISTVGTLLGVPSGAQVLARALDDHTALSASTTSTVVLVKWRHSEARAISPQPNPAGVAVSTTRKLSHAEVREQARRERARRERVRAQRRSQQPAPVTEQPTPEAEATPQEEPSPAPAPAPPPTVPRLIYGAAADAGIDGDYLLSVAYCESSLNPRAVNPAGYYGLFQFDEPTWAEFGYGSIWDPDAQSQTAARMLAAGMYDRWPNCA